jgi:hypothetical protein
VQHLAPDRGDGALAMQEGQKRRVYPNKSG